MISVPVSVQLLLPSVLFLIGLLGVLIRRNVIFMLMAMEIMLNAAGLVFIIGSSLWKQADGQVMVIFILAMAAAEVAVGLALILQVFQMHKTVDVDQLQELKDERERG
ncbi:NADH-quinone oxidoreductase subunit NuoK [Thermoflavifilum thermophilum]|uniref:NADH-quinone oxidoreductase subunit K n=1 Tax=Thermoflavifilum thermophilum TaxID=1393122 RepID=A0A1I7N6R9_9BACT|nr:NADH-quinone oxidoreductase subunit NuoK [Thermoflavifilum thermophilum]SFV30365.1 NADH dehydrogenase subunit K [Thermoflavifilum thermophilum]